MYAASLQASDCQGHLTSTGTASVSLAALTVYVLDVPVDAALARSRAWHGVRGADRRASPVAARAADLVESG
ncbi:hypothetical protein AcW1_002794 [Taiwanofungus camphoratus]|nr:hypothetical protein AcW1_002794 [Antrodia cinnamomea]